VSSDELKDTNNWFLEHPGAHYPCRVGPDHVPGLKPAARRNLYNFLETTYGRTDMNVEMEFLGLFFPNCCFEKLARNTNEYAETLQEKGLAKLRGWKETDAEEMKALHAVITIMGLQKNVQGTSL
jgi:hypothetical protein